MTSVLGQKIRKYLYNNHTAAPFWADINNYRELNVGLEQGFPTFFCHVPLQHFDRWTVPL